MNLKKIYADIKLKVLKIEDISHIKEILNIRNEEKIREVMFNNKLIEMDNHIEWINLNIKNKSKIFYIVFYKNTLIGCVVLSNMSISLKAADWAFYISSKSLIGIGAALEFKFLKKYFENKNYNYLNCEVLYNNQKVIKLHKKFGFQVTKIKKNFIYRESQYIDCASLTLTRERWENEILKIFYNKFIN